MQQQIMCPRIKESAAMADELQGRIYVGAGAGGHVPLPQIHLLPPPQTKKLADFSDVIFEV